MKKKPMKAFTNCPSYSATQIDEQELETLSKQTIIINSLLKTEKFIVTPNPAMTLPGDRIVYNRISGTAVRDYLIRAYFRLQKTPAVTTTISSMIELLEATAREPDGNSGATVIKDIPTGMRLIEDKKKKAVYILLDEESYVVIQPNSAKIVKGMKAKQITEQVAFHWKADDAPQVEPDLSTSAKALMGLLRQAFRIPLKYERVFLAALVSFFCQCSESPILAVCGGKGSGKTTLCKQIMELVSPTVSECVDALPNTEEALVNQLYNSYILCYDNGEFPLKKEVSNMLCVAVTGGKSRKRTLYTDGNEFIMNIRCKLLLNGISEFSNSKSDLVQRAIIMHLDAFEKGSRDGTSRVASRFEALKPRILGSICNTIAEAIADEDAVPKIDDDARLKDFAEFSCRIMRAIGEDENVFLSELLEIVGSEVLDSEQNDLEIQAFRKMLERKPVIRDEPVKVAKQFTRILQLLDKNRAEVGAKALRRILQSKKETLQKLGITVTMSDPIQRCNKRWIELRFDALSDTSAQEPVKKHYKVIELDEDFADL